MVVVAVVVVAVGVAIVAVVVAVAVISVATVANCFCSRWSSCPATRVARYQHGLAKLPWKLSFVHYLLTFFPGTLWSGMWCLI